MNPKNRLISDSLKNSVLLYLNCLICEFFSHRITKFEDKNILKRLEIVSTENSSAKLQVWPKINEKQLIDLKR